MKKSLLLIAALCGFFVSGAALATREPINIAGPALYTDNNLANGSVTSAKIVNNTIADNDIANGTIQSLQIAQGTIADNDIANGTIQSLQIADGTLTSTDIGTQSAIVVTGGTINSATVGATTPAAGSFTTVSSTGTSIVPNRTAPSFVNIDITSTTTTTTGDSVLIRCGNADCSATNPGYAILHSVSQGDYSVFSITSDVKINLTGTQWMIGGTDNDLTGGILRVLAVNDNTSSLRWCVGYLGGRNTVLTTDTTATQSSVSAAEKLLCNTAVGSANNTSAELGWVRADYTYATKIWAIQTGTNDINLGSADGYWQTWKAGYTGFAVIPTTVSTRWTQRGRTIELQYQTNASGTSIATNFIITAPAKAAFAGRRPLAIYTNNSVLASGGDLTLAAGSANLTLDTVNNGAWTGSGSKDAYFGISYEVGPAASFIE